MFNLFRAGAAASAFLGLAALFATPSVAAEAQPTAIATPTNWTLPAGPAVQPTTATLPLQAIPAIPVKSLPMLQPAILAAQYPLQKRSLGDMVASYVDYNDRDEQQECLAKAVYFEARSESLEGQLAVADVVLNRAASGRYPTTICAVVTQPWQFSFIRRGKFPTPDRSSRAWHAAAAIADIASKNLAEVVPPNVLWYHATYVSPSWGQRLTRVTQIGTHIFYS